MVIKYIFIGCLAVIIGSYLIPIIIAIFSFVFGLIKVNSKKEKARAEHIKKLQVRDQTEAELKGSAFESKIRDQILELFPGAKVRQNIIIKNGKFSKEIDLIALTPMGFIVIEAKNYNNCEIIGNVKEKDWNVIYNEHKKFHLYNPIFQVNSGVWNIKKHIPNIYLEKAVVFSDNCKLTDSILKEDCVFTYTSFVNRLMELSELETDSYNETFIEQIDSKLKQIDTVSRNEHIENVKKIRKANA